jgi:nuclear transcription Y subunit beta
MKSCLPASTKISKGAKTSLQLSTSEFISFVTSEAADRCATAGRKTISGEDILGALGGLGFENYEDVAKIYLSRFREVRWLFGTQHRSRNADVELRVVSNEQWETSG